MGERVFELTDVLRLLADNERAAGQALSMVPSEAAMSGIAKLPLLLDAYHRYFFNECGDPERWHFRSGQHLRELEMNLTVPLLTELGGAEWVSARPLSGLGAMTLVLASLGGPPGSDVMTLSPDVGGHYATVRLATRLGLRVHQLGGPDPHGLDLDRAYEQVSTVRPALVYVDQSHCLFPVDASGLVETVRRAWPGTRVHVDTSQWLGLVLGGVFDNPLDCGADSYGGSTHKTFPGPQKGVFLTRDLQVAKQVEETQEYLISSHHFAATISLGIALLEFRQFGAEYARAVVDNTRRFGALLAERGVTVIAADRGFSAGHQLWLDTDADGIPPRIASDRLFQAGIRVNFMAGLPGVTGQAVRIGLNEPTYRGLAEPELVELADVFVAAVRGIEAPGDLAPRVARLPRRAQYGAAVDLESTLARQALALCAAALGRTGGDLPADLSLASGGYPPSAWGEPVPPPEQGKFRGRKN
jgi:glycine/serine hydroxymethyltransferase